MELIQICDIRLGGGGIKFMIRVDGEIGMISLVGEERGYANGGTGCVVVGEFCKVLWSHPQGLHLNRLSQFFSFYLI